MPRLAAGARHPVRFELNGRQVAGEAEPRMLLTDFLRHVLGATGTHPWADYREQRNIDTDHYRRVVDGLRYVARRNNTFSLHVHAGVHGIDRAVRTCDRLRPVLPVLLAASANSPFLEGLDSGLASARTQIFTRTFTIRSASAATSRSPRARARGRVSP